jgi:hypothetical protein
MKAFQVSDNFDKVKDLDFSGLILSAWGLSLIGTLSIDIEGRGWVDFTGEHGFNDYVDEYGFIIDMEEA